MAFTKAELGRVRDSVQSRLESFASKVDKKFRVSIWSTNERKGSVISVVAYVFVPSNGGKEGATLPFDSLTTLRKVSRTFGVRGVERTTFEVSHTNKTVGARIHYMIPEATAKSLSAIRS